MVLAPSSSPVQPPRFCSVHGYPIAVLCLIVPNLDLSLHSFLFTRNLQGTPAAEFWSHLTCAAACSSGTWPITSCYLSSPHSLLSCLHPVKPLPEKETLKKINYTQLVFSWASLTCGEVWMGVPGRKLQWNMVFADLKHHSPVLSVAQCVKSLFRHSVQLYSSSQQKGSVLWPFLHNGWYRIST